MKAIVCERYGAPETLRIAEVASPVPRDGELLIRVRAVGLNPLDWHLIRGTPYVVRLAFGLRRPRNGRPGVDFAGVVESVGRSVAGFAAGDAVFGMARGALAELVCASAAKVAAKPPGIPFEQAAALPVAGVTALQGLRDKARLQPAQTVLINGASGGVGTFAVQIAKMLGATVTGVCGAKNVDLVRSLGADRVIDYTREDFTRIGSRWDVILDCVGNVSVSSARRALRPGGAHVGVGALTGRWLQPLPHLLGLAVLSPFVGQKMTPFIARVTPEDLATLGGLVASGTIAPVIGTTYPFSETAAAMRHLAGKHARGKIVVTL